MTSHVAGFDAGSSTRHLASGREILPLSCSFSVNILFLALMASSDMSNMFVFIKSMYLITLSSGKKVNYIWFRRQCRVIGILQ